MEEKVYTKEEVQKLLEPLMKQIEFLSGQYLECKKYIAEPWYRKFGSRNKFEFLRRCWADEDSSDTLIFNQVKFAKSDPEMFEFLKEFYDKKGPKNN